MVSFQISMTLRHRQIDIVVAQRAGSLSDMLAITNTPLDAAIEYAASGRAIYQPHVMQCYLPHEIEPFYLDPAIPVSFGPNDVVEWRDWHRKHAGIRGRDPEDEFVHWRRFYMNWHTEDELRNDAKKACGKSADIRASEAFL